MAPASAARRAASGSTQRAAQPRLDRSPPISLWRRLAGYGAVSVVSVVVTQAVLLVTYGRWHWPAVAANVTAVSAGALPGYLGNRMFVWRKTEPHSLRREVLPFWAYSLAGLALSSLFVAMADRWWHSAVFVAAANLTGFGLLWAGKFVLLDRVLFAPAAPASDGLASDGLASGGSTSDGSTARADDLPAACASRPGR